jgi:hypothetical protein
VLPNTWDFDEMLSDSTEEQENTKTFEVRRLTVPVDPYEVATLGVFGLGTTVLNKTVLYDSGGKIDDLDALRQSIHLTLNVEADQYIIYPYTHGIKTVDLIGMPHYYVVAVLPNRIKEALLSDDRITDVSDFEFEVNKKKVHASFIVHSIYGTVDEEVVVSY